MLTYLPGASPHPGPWGDDAVFAIGRLLRAAHDATSGFVPPRDAVWQPWFGRNLSGQRPVIGHCDAGAWNIVALDGTPYAFIDWEYAGPVDDVWELAHVAWQNSQLFDDDIAERVVCPRQEPVRGRSVSSLTPTALHPTSESAWSTAW